jgi:hypothetical protein
MIAFRKSSWSSTFGGMQFMKKAFVHAMSSSLLSSLVIIFLK